MLILVIGLFLFASLHMLPAFPSARKKLVDKMGEGMYQGIFSLFAVGTVCIIVLGFSLVPYIEIWAAPPGSLHIIFIGMFFSVHLNVLTYTRSNIKRLTNHPMLWGMVLWGVVHLYLNGDLRSVTLFGFVILFSLYKIWDINCRKSFEKKEFVSYKGEIFYFVITIIFAAIIVWTHEWVGGKPILVYLRAITGI